jgi:hypothetical protein
MFPRMRNYDFNYQLPAQLGGIMTLDDVKRISPFFTDTNPVTYAVLLDMNKDKYTNEEKINIQNLISFLSNKERTTMEAVAQHLRTREEYEAEQVKYNL